MTSRKTRFAGGTAQRSALSSAWLLPLATLGFACGSSTATSVVDGGSDTGIIPIVVPDATTREASTVDASDAMVVIALDGPSIFGDAGGSDGSDDAPSSHEAGSTDSSKSDGPATDAVVGKPDVATLESGTDDTGPMLEAGPDAVTHADTGPIPEAGACVPVSVPTSTSGLFSCGNPVSGTCGPADVSNFSPTSHAPNGAHQGRCTSAEIQQVYDGCLNGNGTCPNDDCTACIFTSESGATWGPAVENADNLISLNVGGCISILEPCNAACGNAFTDTVECGQAACGTNCPTDADAASINNFEQCENTIDNCAPHGCATYYVGTGCGSSLTGTAHPASVCLTDQSNFEAAFLAIVPVFCGQ